MSMFMANHKLSIITALVLVSCSESVNPSSRRGIRLEVNDSVSSDNNGDLNPQTSSCPRYPLVFLHGFLAGDRIGNFAGVKKHFEAKGCKVLVAQVSPVNSIEFRGQQLAELVKKFLGEASVSKVNIVAHSQGGS